MTPDVFPSLDHAERLGCRSQARLCPLAPDPHPSGPTSAARLCARWGFPNPFCCGAGSCQSSLCLPAKAAAFQPHLQPGRGLRCLSPSEAVPEAGQDTPDPASAPGASSRLGTVSLQRQQTRDYSSQNQPLAESSFLRWHIKVMEKAIFCLLRDFQAPRGPEKGLYTVISSLHQLKDEFRSRYAKGESAIDTKSGSATSARAVFLVAPAQAQPRSAGKPSRSRRIQGKGIGDDFQVARCLSEGRRRFFAAHLTDCSYTFP